MRDEKVPEPRPHALLCSSGTTDRRSCPGRRGESDRRCGLDRRQPRNDDLWFAELEMRVATATRQSAGAIEGDGSGWDKLIVPFG